MVTVRRRHAGRSSEEGQIEHDRALVPIRWYGRTQSLKQSIDENRLSLQDLPSRVGNSEPSRAVDFRKGPTASGAWRPFHLEGIAADERGIPVAFDGPRLNDLAARLKCLAERKEISVRVVSGLFDEFAPSGG